MKIAFNSLRLNSAQNNNKNVSNVISFRSKNITETKVDLSTFPEEKLIQIYGASNAIPTNLQTTKLNKALALIKKNTPLEEVKTYLESIETHPTTKTLLQNTKTEDLSNTIKKMRDYANAESISAYLAKNGYGVLTGSSVGIMEAANKGAKEHGGYSVGVAMNSLKDEQKSNSYLDELHVEPDWHKRIDKYNGRAKGPFTLVFPGGDGSICELWDKVVQNILDSYKTGETPKKVVLVDKKFWAPMVKWLNSEPSERGYLRCINKNMIEMVDNLKGFKEIFPRL